MKKLLLGAAFLLSALLPALAQPLVNRPITGQVAIAVTGTAIQLPANSLVNGAVVKAKGSNNVACGTVGGSTVTNTYDGTGNGYGICPGEASSFAITNTSALWVNGTAGDIFTFEGN